MENLGSTEEEADKFLEICNKLGYKKINWKSAENKPIEYVKCITKHYDGRAGISYVDHEGKWRNVTNKKEYFEETKVTEWVGVYEIVNGTNEIEKEL